MMCKRYMQKVQKVPDGPQPPGTFRIRPGEGARGTPAGVPQLICLRQIKALKSFSAGHAPAENPSTQPPWAASPVTDVTGEGGGRGGTQSPFEAHRMSLSVRLCRNSVTSAVLFSGLYRPGTAAYRAAQVTRSCFQVISLGAWA